MDVEGAWDMPSLLAAVGTGHPTIVLIKSSCEDAPALLEASLGLSPSTKVIVFDLSAKRESEIIAAAEAGVAGLHLHSESFDHLLGLIQTASAGGAQCSEVVSGILLRRVYAFAGQSDPASQTEMLSPLEVEILELIVKGLTNKQIASTIALTLPTVKNHVHRLLAKMGVSSRAEAVEVYRANQYNAPDSGLPPS